MRSASSPPRRSAIAGLESAAEQRVDEARPPVARSRTARADAGAESPSGRRASRRGCGTNSTLAEPVRMKRPGVLRRSMAALSEVKISGTRCTSSRMVFAGRSVTKPTGSVSAAAPHGLVVERHVAVPAGLADGARERRLAALPRAVDQHGRRVARAPRAGEARGSGGRAWRRGAWRMLVPPVG